MKIQFTPKAIQKGFDPEEPLCFLDLDGVCNNQRYFRDLDESGYKKSFMDKLDPRSIEFLNEIKTWNFVISSTWRKFKTVEQLNEILSSLGFKGKVLDVTPDFNWKGALRGNEIREWIKDNVISGDTNRYVIFDDDSDMLFWQRNNFIHIDGYFGLSPNHIYRAKRLMVDTESY